MRLVISYRYINIANIYLIDNSSETKQKQQIFAGTNSASALFSTKPGGDHERRGPLKRS
jgi:hypothetical protein